MNEHAKRIQKPRCFLLYALAPDGMPAADANRILNQFIGDSSLPLAIFHDHFIGQPGGLVIFNVENSAGKGRTAGTKASGRLARGNSAVNLLAQSLGLRCTDRLYPGSLPRIGLGSPSKSPSIWKSAPGSRNRRRKRRCPSIKLWKL